MNLPGEKDPPPGEETRGDLAPEPPDPQPPRPTPEELDRIFGTVLPEVTGDERGLADYRGDDWFLTNRPPHHG